MSEHWDARLHAIAQLRAHGDWDGAEQAYHRLWDEAIAARAGGAVPAILVARGRLWQLRGRRDEAIELTELAREVALLHEDLLSAARAVNLLGVMSVERQEWEGARAHFEEALERAYEVRDDELVGAVATNLGAISNILGSLQEARSYYLESLGSNVRADSRAQLVMAYNNLGMVCSDTGEWMEALVYFGRAIEIADEEENVGLVALLHVNQAEPLIETGDFTAALKSLDRAAPIAVQLGNMAVQADDARFRGRIERICGAWEAAGVSLDRALAVARHAGLELHEAEALEEMALLHLAKDAPGEARAVLAEARVRYESVGARRDAERVALLHRDLPDG